jgi:ATP-dependent DNA ligase
MLQRTLPAGFIAPCLPTKTDKLPSGSQWLHEIRHDGFRIIARKSNGRVRLYSRPGNGFTRRFPLIVDALARFRLPGGAPLPLAPPCNRQRPF